MPEDELIVAAGTTGEVVQIGHHEEANIPVYIVEFGATEARIGRVVGCLEGELAAARALPVAGATMIRQATPSAAPANLSAGASCASGSGAAATATCAPR